MKKVRLLGIIWYDCYNIWLNLNKPTHVFTRNYPMACSDYDFALYLSPTYSNKNLPNQTKSSEKINQNPNQTMLVLFAKLIVISAQAIAVGGSESGLVCSHIQIQSNQHTLLATPNQTQKSNHVCVVRNVDSDLSPSNGMWWLWIWFGLF